MKYQQWNIAQRSQEAYKAMERQGVPTLVAATLCARGMTDLAEAKGLLSSGEDQLQDPFLMKDMDLATARIGRALRNGEKIAVYGDYDVDGITSTCLLTHYLRAQGGDVCYYIPNRLSEGYGVNREAVEELARQGVRLMITVDCGITAVEEVAYASGLGIDVIITDHHECKEEIPAAVAVVDPHRKDCPYPFKDLAGVGVALKLVMAWGGKAVPRPLPGVRRPGRRGHRGRRDEAFGGEPHHCPGGPEPPEKNPPPWAVRPHGGGGHPEPGHHLHHRGLLSLPPDQRRRPDGPGGDRGGAHPHRGQQPGRAAGPRAV